MITGPLSRSRGGRGVDRLVEVHDDGELERALRAKARLIGVNNRDLKTFKVDLAPLSGWQRALQRRSPRAKSSW